MSAYYEFGPGYDAAFGVLGMLGGLLGLWAIFAIVCYVLYSLGLYTMAKRRGIRCYGLAWVPVANLWILGSISDQYKYVTAGKNQKRRGILLGLSIALVVLVLSIVIFMIQQTVSLVFHYGDFVPEAQIVQMVGGILIFWVLTMVVAITMAVFEYITLYNLYHSAIPEDATLFLVLSIFFGVTIPFFVFACRKKDGGMPQRYAPAPEMQTAYIPAAPVREAPSAAETAPAAAETAPAAPAAVTTEATATAAPVKPAAAEGTGATEAPAEEAKAEPEKPEEN